MVERFDSAENVAARWAPGYGVRSTPKAQDAVLWQFEMAAGVASRGRWRGRKPP